MARPQSPKAGVGPCPDPACGASIVFRLSSGGMLTHKCDYCDSSGFAQKDGDAYKRRVKAFTANHLQPQETPAQATPGGNPKETKTPPPKDVPPKGARTVFELGSL